MTESVSTANLLEKDGYWLTAQYAGTKVQLYPQATPFNRVAIRKHADATRHQFAFLLKGSGVLVADLDSDEAFRFATENGLDDCNMSIKTRRGEHRFFDAPWVKNNVLNYDGRGIDFL